MNLFIAPSLIKRQRKKERQREREDGCLRDEETQGHAQRMKNKREREKGRARGPGYVKEIYIAHKRQKEKPDLFLPPPITARGHGGHTTPGDITRPPTTCMSAGPVVIATVTLPPHVSYDRGFHSD